MDIELYVLLSFLIVGVSHIARPEMWVDLFNKMIAAGVAAPVIAGMHLPLGLVLIITHNDWQWQPGIIFTILGWSYTFKGTLYLIFPDTVRRVVSVQQHPVRNMRIAGFMIFLLMIPMALAVWS
jgi:hypothetical protein